MRSIRNKFLPGLMILTILSFSAIAFVSAAVAAPTTYVVNSTGDANDVDDMDGVCDTGNTVTVDGNDVPECTLRAAIQDANKVDDGADTIEFNIPGNGPHSIPINVDLPDIGAQITIDGTTQPGYVANSAVWPNPLNGTLAIEIKGDFTNDNHPNKAFNFKGDGSVLKGVAINGFAHQIEVYADDVVIQGNYLGTNIDGTQSVSNGTPWWEGLKYYDFNDEQELPTGLILGGALPEQRNIITGSETQGAFAAEGSNGTVYGNYFCLAKDGVTGLGCSTDIQFNFEGLGGRPGSGSNYTIGGPGTGQGNIFAGASNMNLNVVGPGTVIQGNMFSTDYQGNTNGSVSGGIGITAVFGTQNVLIGGDQPGEGNLFRGNEGSAVVAITFDLQFVPAVVDSQNITVIGNSIYDIAAFPYYNFGDSNMGIDIMNAIYTAPPQGPPDVFSNQGPNANDTGDADGGSNGFLNTPVINSAQQIDGDININFDLDAAGSSSNYRVEFFASETSTVFGYGPGQHYLGHVDVTSGTNRTATFDLDGLDVAGMALSATTTSKSTSTDNGWNGTSEFSQNVQIGTASDFDADGLSDNTEDAASNSGDGNDDGTLDKYQSRVSSYTIGGVPVTFVTSGDGCAANGSVVPEEASTADTGFAYPYGLTDFTLNCTKGGEAEITKYVFDDTDDELTDFSVRKYRPNTHTYEAVEGSTVSRETIGDETALVMSYTLSDGGTLDDDGVENGIIVDPVGLAHVFTESQVVDTPTTTTTTAPSGSSQNTKSASGTLSTTGANSNQLFNISLSMLFAGLTVALIAKAKGRKARA